MRHSSLFMLLDINEALTGSFSRKILLGKKSWMVPSFILGDAGKR